MKLSMLGKMTAVQLITAIAVLVSLVFTGCSKKAVETPIEEAVTEAEADPAVFQLDERKPADTQEETVYTSADGLAAAVNALPPNTEDAPYRIALEGADIDAASLKNELGTQGAGKLYNFISLDLSNCTSIHDAFELSELSHNAKITGLVLPATFVTVPSGAFAGAAFAALELPESLSTIEKSAFAGSVNLAKVTFRGENPPVIGRAAFASCREDLFFNVPARVRRDYEAALADALSEEAPVEAEGGEGTATVSAANLIVVGYRTSRRSSDRSMEADPERAKQREERRKQREAERQALIDEAIAKGIAEKEAEQQALIDEAIAKGVAEQLAALQTAADEAAKAAAADKASAEKAAAAKAAADKLAAEKAAADKAKADKAAADKIAADKAAKDKAAVDKAAADKLAADKAAKDKAAADKVAADKKAAADKVAADKKAAADKVAADKKAADAVLASATHKIGDKGPAGGIVFYDKGNNSGGWRYLEAAPQDFGNVQWGLYQYYVRDLGRKIGDGKKNTEILNAAINAGAGMARSSAATIVFAINKLNSGALNGNGFNEAGYKDWFLPSAAELNLLYKNLAAAGIGNFGGGWYWSSSQCAAGQGEDFDAQYAFSQNMDDGKEWNYCKYNSGGFSARAIRAF